MSNLYNRLQELCEEKGVSGYRMCKDVGIQPSIMTDLKMGRRSSMKAETAQKVADYFGVTVGYLLGEQKETAPTNTGRDGEHAIDVVDDELRDYLEELRSRPEKKLLFSVTKNATKEQIEAIVKMIDAMQGNDGT